MKKGFFSLILGNGFSKILGLLREILVAYWFGTSFIADAYRIALSVVLLPTQLIMGDAFQSAFIPYYKKSISNKSNKLLFGLVFFCLLIISIFLLLVLWLLGDRFVKFISPGFSEKAIEFTIHLVKVMACSLPFYVISYLIVYVLNASGKFGFSSVSSIIQNLFLIIFSALAYWLSQPILMGWGFVGPFVFLSILLIYYTWKNKIISKESFHIDIFSNFSLLFGFSKDMIPLLIYMLLFQFKIFIERIVSSKLGEGAVASIDYARFLYETPLYLLAIPLATVSLTYFSNRSWDEKSRKKIEDIIMIALMMFIPMSSILFAKSELFVKLLYARGEFSGKSVEVTADALSGFSIGLWAAGLSMFLQKVYSAYLRNREILILSGISISVNIVLNLFVVKYLGVFGVAFSFSLSMLIQMLLLLSRMKLNIQKIITFTSVMITASLLYYFISSNTKSTNIIFDLVLNFIILVCYWSSFFMIYKPTRLYLNDSVRMLKKWLFTTSCT